MQEVCRLWQRHILPAGSSTDWTGWSWSRLGLDLNVNIFTLYKKARRKQSELLCRRRLEEVRKAEWKAWTSLDMDSISRMEALLTESLNNGKGKLQLVCILSKKSHIRKTLRTLLLVRQCREIRITELSNPLNQKC